MWDGMHANGRFSRHRTRQHSAYPARDSLTSVMSVNAAISASVVLASRLVDDVSVFALMLFSIEAFALFPLLRRRLQVRLVLPRPIFFKTWLALNATAPDCPDGLSESHGLFFRPSRFPDGRAVTHCGVPVRGRLRFRNVDRTLSARLGAAVQEVSFSLSPRAHIHTLKHVCIGSEIRGNWDPAVPKVNLGPSHGARPGGG